MSDKKQTYSTLETVFLVMIVVTSLLPRGHAIDAAHARAEASFRLAMIGIGLTGRVVTSFLKRRLPPEPSVALASGLPPGVAPPLEPGAIRLAYQVTKASAWRGEWYGMTHRWQTVASLVVAPLVWFLLSLLGGVLTPAGALARLALIFLGWFAFLSLLYGLAMRKRYPCPDSVRVCTTTLNAAGYEDVTPDKVYSVPWREVTDIREHDGDIFLWRGGAQGNIVNREAFQDRRQAQEFYAAAVALWKGKAADWPYAPSSTQTDDRVWPPPPQVR